MIEENDETITISVVIKRESERAFLVDDGEEHWIPKSQIQEPENYGVSNAKVNLVISLWIAEQKGLV